MLPIRDNVPTRTFPVVSVALIAVNVVVWLLYELPNLTARPDSLPSSRAGQDWPLTAVTSMFMHGSWLHLGGNMLFLWILYFFVNIPAFLFLGFWFLFQLWQGGYAIVHPEAGGGVAFFAHVGGFAFGLLTVKAFSVRAPLRPSF